MTRTWKTLVARLDALAPRERLAVFAAAALAIAVLAYVAGIEPALQRGRQLAARSADHERMLATLQAQQRELAGALARDPDVPLREQTADAQRQVAQIDARLAGLQRTLVPPERMPGVLRELMGRHKGVQLVSLRNLPPSPLLAAPSADAPSDEAAAAAADETAAPHTGVGRNVYRHGVEIVLQGSYLDLLAYLSRLEQQPWQVFWGRTVLSADYPTAVVSLTLYTLSLDKAWLTV